MPLGELLGDPDRVLLGVEHVEHVRGRVDSLSIREIVGGEQPQLDRLRLDAERLGGERALHVERGFFMAADGQHRFAGGRLFDHVARDATPAHADVFHAEVVVGSHVEHKLLAIEHDFAARQIFARELRRFIVLGGDCDLERLFAGEAEFVLPMQIDLLRVVDQQFRRRERSAGRRACLAV